MAVNAYLIVDGRPGPSSRKQNAIDVLSFGFGASQTGSGRADINDVMIMKCVDSVSPLLFEDCVTGNFLKSVDIVYTKATGDEQQDFYRIQLEDALITSIQHYGSDENPMESVSFAFSRVKIGYNPEAGGRLKAFIERGFDLLTLKPW